MPTLRSVHRFFHKLVPAMLTGLGAVLYRAGQEIDWIPKDVVVFPFLALLAWALFLYWFFAGPRAVRLYNNAYKKWAKERRLMAYGLAILIGSVVGGGTGAASWKLFESHRKQMAKLKEKPGAKNDEAHGTTRTVEEPKSPEVETTGGSAGAKPKQHGTTDKVAPKPASVSEEEQQRILSKIESDLAELKKSAGQPVSMSNDSHLKLLEDSQQMLEALDVYANEYVKQVQALPGQVDAINKRVGRDGATAMEFKMWREQMLRQKLQETYQETYADKAKMLRGQLMREVPGVSETFLSYDNPPNGGTLNAIYFDFKGLVEAYRNKLISEGKVKP